jgi:hypothetical protein
VSRPDAAALPARPAWRIWLRRIAPWVIATGVLVFVLREHSPARILEEMGHGNSLPLIPLALVLIFANLVLICLADRIVIGPHVEGMRYVDLLRGKAAAALLGMVGYAAGHGGYAVWIARRNRTGAPVAGGLLLYIMASELTAVALVASLSSLLADDVPDVIRIGAPATASVLIFLMLIAPFNLLGDTSRVLKPWRMPRRYALAQVAVRTVQLCGVALATWLAMLAFGLEVPLWAVVAYLPIVLVVGSLPVNVAGFGAVNGAWLLFTPEHATGPEILAFQFLWQVACGAAIGLRGLPFIRRFVVEIDEGQPLR